MIAGSQIVSLAFIWIFVLSVNCWILSLLQVARKLNDSINASVAIGIIAIPPFFLIAGILTYVFVGLRRHPSPSEVVPLRKADTRKGTV